MEVIQCQHYWEICRSAFSLTQREPRHREDPCGDVYKRQLKELSRDSIKIPLGNLTGNGFLSARGPNIDCRFIPVGSIEIKTLSKFEACGINQTRHQIVVSVETEISAVTSFKSVRVKVPTDFVLAETVIVGSVPENYTQVLTSDRELISEINDYKAGVQ